VIAGTHSGVGKTTVATGLMAAFAQRGLRIGAAKVGPDYIDPGYHALAAGRPSRNLDAWLCGEDAIVGLAHRAADGRDLLVVEGVMGLFDGAAGSSPAGFASTAHVARLLDAPIVLVVDAAAMSGSVAALVHGFARFDPTLRLAGVILNRVGSDSHEAMLREALAPGEMPVLGVLRRDGALTWRDRHLGLVPVVEHPAEVLHALDRLAATIGRSCDLPAIEAVARSAGAVAFAPARGPSPVVADRVALAVASGPAFSFSYPDNLEALEAAGAEIVPFDPLTAAALPTGARGLIIGGGFPEVYAAELASNDQLRADVHRRVKAGLVTWAECGGLLWLSRTLDGKSMAGVLPCAATMGDRLTLGYRTATVLSDSPLATAGTVLHGHEFHYSAIDPAGDALALSGRTGSSRGGYVSPTLLASYLHLHLGASPHLAESFVRQAGRDPVPG